MINKKHKKSTNKSKDGFSLTEAIVATSIFGVLSSIAIPNYLNSNNNTKLSAAKATITSIPPIIGAHINETGEAPSSWDDLSSIAVVMTNNGPATGDLEKPITLPDSIYDLSIEGPTKSIYTLTATRVIDKNNENSDNEGENSSNEKFQFAIKSCFNVSNGASDLRTGNLSDIESKLNCG